MTGRDGEPTGSRPAPTSKTGLARLQNALPAPDPDVAAGEILILVDFVLISSIFENKNSILEMR